MNLITQCGLHAWVRVRVIYRVELGGPAAPYMDTQPSRSKVLKLHVASPWYYSVTMTTNLTMATQPHHGNISNCMYVRNTSALVIVDSDSVGCHVNHHSCFIQF